MFVMPYNEMQTAIRYYQGSIKLLYNFVSEVNFIRLFLEESN